MHRSTIFLFKTFANVETFKGTLKYNFFFISPVLLFVLQSKYIISSPPILSVVTAHNGKIKHFQCRYPEKYSTSNGIVKLLFRAGFVGLRRGLMSDNILFILYDNSTVLVSCTQSRPRSIVSFSDLMNASLSIARQLCKRLFSYWSQSLQTSVLFYFTVVMDICSLIVHHICRPSVNQIHCLYRRLLFSIAVIVYSVIADASLTTCIFIKVQRRVRTPRSQPWILFVVFRYYRLIGVNLSCIGSPLSLWTFHS